MSNRGIFRLTWLGVFVLGGCVSAPPKEAEPWPFASAPQQQATPAASGRSGKTVDLDAAIERRKKAGKGLWRERTLEDYERMGGTLVRAITLLRELEPKDGFHFQLLGPEKFEAALDATRRGRDLDALERRFDAQLLAFGLATDFAEAPTEGAKSSDALAGFYDPDTKLLFVRNRMPGSFDEAEQDELVRGTIAHEMQHAVQHQHFGVPDLWAETNDDRRLALKALYEGDAMLAQVSIEWALHGMGPQAAIPAHATFVKLRRNLTSRVEKVGFQAGLGTAPAWVRESFMFPYEGGAVFLAAFYVTGGFLLVNRVFSAPPVSTEQVLHPERYLRGDLPWEVPFPRVPPATTLVAQGTLGELGVRTLIDECSDHAFAVKAAEGWGGDAYVIAADAQGKLALAWNTVWDTEADARDFVTALEQGRDCAVEVRSPKRGWSVRGAFSVKRQGHRVAVVRGLEKALVAGEQKAMLAGNVRHPPSQPVLGAITLKPNPFARFEEQAMPEEARLGRLSGRRYEHPWLGVKADVPPGLDVIADTATGALHVRVAGKTRVEGSLLFVKGSDALDGDAPIDGERGAWDNLLFGETDRALQRILQRERLVAGAKGERELPLGKAKTRRWQARGKGRTIEAVLIPACEGRGAFYFLHGFEGRGAEKLVDTWLRAFTALPEPGVCEVL